MPFGIAIPPPPRLNCNDSFQFARRRTEGTFQRFYTVGMSLLHWLLALAFVLRSRLRSDRSLSWFSLVNGPAAIRNDSPDLFDFGVDSAHFLTCSVHAVSKVQAEHFLLKVALYEPNHVRLDSLLAFFERLRRSLEKMLVVLAYLLGLLLP